MDKINFLAKDDFPAASDDLDRLQSATYMVARLAALGGANYILSGCEVDGSNVASGTIVIDGEILPFQGGAKKNKIAIRETKTPLEAFDQLYPEAYTDRLAVFSDEGPYMWDDFKQVLTNRELETKISQIRGEPPGMKIEWTGRIDRIPENYMLADGRILRTEDYPDLAYVYGMEHEESFTLPDYRHMFIVGYDATMPDYNTIGKHGGSAQTTLDMKNVPVHYHAYTDDTNAQGKYPQIEPGFPTSITGIAGVKSSASESGWGTVYNTGKAGGNADGITEPFDNRPQFCVLAFLIKVKY